MKTPSERFLEQFVPLMEQRHYVYKRTGHRFVRPFAFGTQEFSLSFDGRGGLVSVEGRFSVHFKELERQYKAVFGRPCHHCAGADFGRAGLKDYKFDLFDPEYVLTPKEMSQFPPEVIHPQAKVDHGVQHFIRAHDEFAEALYARVDTLEKLRTFYLEFLDDRREWRCRPVAEVTYFLSILLARILARDPDELRALEFKVRPFNNIDLQSEAAKVFAYLQAPQA